MIVNLKKEIRELFFKNGIKPCKAYLEVIDAATLFSNTETMYAINESLFDNKPLLAGKFFGHAEYETMGGHLIKEFAENFVTGKLKEELIAQSKDELKHGRMLLFLAEKISKDPVDYKLFSSEEVMPDFQNNTKYFLCLVHVSELKTLVMLAQYRAILTKGKNAKLRENMLPLLENILKDEEQHALYTGEYISKWIKEDKKVAKLLKETFDFVNQESLKEADNLQRAFSEA